MNKKHSFFFRSQTISTYLGNLFEHYDTALFGFLSPFLAPIFFPEHEPLNALILTYAITPIGMLARPLGSMVVGYIGDIYSRTHALFLALMGMAIVSASIAFIPTYSEIGIWAVFLFFIGKALQNFFSAGETMGGAIFLLENASEKKHDLLSGFYGASSMGGHILAFLGVYLLNYYGQIDVGWRFLYLFGAITAFFACMLRYYTPAISTNNIDLFSISKLIKILWVNRKPLILIAINAGFSSATYSIALVLLNGFIPLTTSFASNDVMKMNSYLLVLDLCALPFFGWVSSKISRERLMLFSSLTLALLSAPLFMLLAGASFFEIILIRIFFVILGVAFFSPFYAWTQQLIPPANRYAILSFGYALGTQVLGAPTAAISLWLYKQTGIVASVSWYWIFLAVLSAISIAKVDFFINVSHNSSNIKFKLIK